MSEAYLVGSTKGAEIKCIDLGSDDIGWQQSDLLLQAVKAGWYTFRDEDQYMITVMTAGNIDPDNLPSPGTLSFGTQVIVSSEEPTIMHVRSLTMNSSGVFNFSAFDNTVTWEMAYSNFAIKFSPTFSGTPSAPTAAVGSNTTQLATTAFVQSALPSQILTIAASRTLALTDANKLIITNTTGAVVITIPLATSVNFVIGTELEVFRRGTGAVSFSAAAGVTILRQSALTIKDVNTGASLKKIDTNVWILQGNLG